MPFCLSPIPEGPLFLPPDSASTLCWATVTKHTAHRHTMAVCTGPSRQPEQGSYNTEEASSARTAQGSGQSPAPGRLPCPHLWARIPGTWEIPKGSASCHSSYSHTIPRNSAVRNTEPPATGCVTLDKLLGHSVPPSFSTERWRWKDGSSPPHTPRQGGLQGLFRGRCLEYRLAIKDGATVTSWKLAEGPSQSCGMNEMGTEKCCAGAGATCQPQGHCQHPPCCPQ